MAGTSSDIDGKTILLDALDGAGTGGYEMSQAMVDRGLAQFSGNQWNASWSWMRDKLEALTFEELSAIYFSVKNAK